MRDAVHAARKGEMRNTYKIDRETWIGVRWVLFTTAWRVLRLRMDGWPPDTGGSCKLNKHSRTADYWLSSSFWVGRGANNPSP